MGNPTHEQGKLQLEFFEMRREPRLRQAREWFQKNYSAESFEESMKIAAFGTEAGTNLMMVATYWEQACSYLHHGLLNEELFFENNGEFFMVWDGIKGMVPGFREMFAAPHFMRHMENTAAKYEAWMEKRAPGHVARMREFRKQMKAQMQKPAA